MTRATWSMKCGGRGWTKSQRPRLTTGATAAAEAAMPMPHRPRSATVERGNAGAMDMMKELQVPITLNTAGGLSSALGTVRIACDRLMSGKFDAIVMPETPS
eukprot:6798468-Pyramimonas_sp.AAC.1